jgi:hypothetical protein
VVGVLLVPFVAEPVLGPQYGAAEVVIQLTVLGLPFASLVSVQASLLQGVGLKAYVTRVAFIGTAICLAGVAVGGLLTGGAVGAMIGYTVGLVAQAGILTTRAWMLVRQTAQADAAQANPAQGDATQANPAQGDATQTDPASSTPDPASSSPDPAPNSPDSAPSKPVPAAADG